MRRPFGVLELLAAGVAIVLVVGMAALLFMVMWAQFRLRGQIAGLRLAREPLSLAELVREPIPAVANAATYLRQAQSDLKAIEQAVSAAGSEAEGDALGEGHATPAQLQAIRAALARYPDAIPLVEQASRCPDYDPQLPLASTAATFPAKVLPPIQESRAAMRVLRYRVVDLLASEKNEEALDACLTMLRLTRHFDRSPMRVSNLVAIALRRAAIKDANLALRSGPLPDVAYGRLEAELALHDLREAYRQSLRSERALGMQYFDEMPYGPAGGPWIPGLLGRCSVSGQSEYLELIDEMIRAADRPFGDFSGRGAPSTPFVKLLTVGLEAQLNAHCRVLAELRALRILNAILRREQAGKSGKPKLTDLDLPADVLVDPYDGESMRLKKTPNGWVIYSVGARLRDDGGKNLGEQWGQNVGLGPIESPATKPSDDGGEKSDP